MGSISIRTIYESIITNKQNNKNCRAISIEMGIQNSGLGAGHGAVDIKKIENVSCRDTSN